MAEKNDITGVTDLLQSKRDVISDAVIEAALFQPSITAPRRSTMTEAQKALIRANATLRIRTALYKRYLDRLEFRQ